MTTREMLSETTQARVAPKVHTTVAGSGVEAIEVVCRDAKGRTEITVTVTDSHGNRRTPVQEVAGRLGAPSPAAGTPPPQRQTGVRTLAVRFGFQAAASARGHGAPAEAWRASPAAECIRRRQARSAVAALPNDLLGRVLGCSPAFFEKLVFDLLTAMGYGGPNRCTRRTIRRCADGGIDGIIDQDELGMNSVCFQAKRWTGTVGRPVVQSFVGSLEGRGYTKGVLVTTSHFSREAREYANRIGKRLRLVDGKELANLMMRHGIGVVQVATPAVRKADSDYFQED